MKNDMIAKVCATAGILLMAYAVIGRFVYGPTVLGWVPYLRQGMAAGSAMLGANSLLLIAVLAKLFEKK